MGVSVRTMGRLGEVSLFLALFLLLGILHGTRAQYDSTLDDFEDYDEREYDFVEDEEEDYQEEDAEPEPERVEAADAGETPTAGPQNQEFTPMCNNENCWIRVDWSPPPRDTWMSCLLGYRVGFRKPGDDWTWMNDEGTHIDLRSDKLFFFEEAEGTNHSLTIHNLDYETNYEIVIDVFNPYGRRLGQDEAHVSSPPEPCREASVPRPDKFVESSENSLSVHLDGWQDTNCRTVYFIVEQRERARKDLAHESPDGPRCRGVREGVHCHRTLYCLHFHPRDGDLRSQGSQRCCDIGLRWWRNDLWQA